MLEQLTEIIVRYAEADPDDIKPDAKLVEELGLTSFDVMSLMGDIEDEFGIIVEEEELLDLSTVDDVMQYIAKKQGGTSF